MTSKKRKGELEQLCRFQGIPLSDGAKYTKADLVYKLGLKSLEKGIRQNSWGLTERLKVKNPMLCSLYKNLKQEQKNIIIADDNDWIAERKWNGARMVIFYHPDVGFQFFSRHTSDIDFLPIEYPNILVLERGVYRQGFEFKNRWKFPFIIDSEVITTGKELDLSVLPKNATRTVSPEEIGRSFQIHSELNAACSIIQYNASDSFILQKQNPLVFQVFDVIMIDNHYLYSVPLFNRLKILTDLLKFLPDSFRPCSYTNVKKMDYFEDIVTNQSAEGCFQGKTKVNMADGSYKKIKDIEPGDVVLSYNIEKKCVEPKKVIRKFNNGFKPVTEWVSTTHDTYLTYNSSGHRRSIYNRIVSTKNHKFYDGERYSAIYGLNYCYELNKQLDDFRREALIGWLISDGHIDSDSSIGLSQKYDSPFWNYTVDMYKDFANKAITCTSGKGSKIGYMRLLKRYTREFQGLHRVTNKDTISILLDKMTPLSWAYAFMCDGSYDGHKGKPGALIFSCHSFTEEEVLKAKESLKLCFNIPDEAMTNKFDKRVKGYGCAIRIGTKYVPMIAKKIGKYIHPSMRYKFLGQDLEPFISYPEIKVDLEKATIIQRELTDEKRYNGNNHFKLTAWDLEVEDNHNYFVENVLVHNCVFKRLDSPYNNAGTRHADKWVKLKRDMATQSGKDIDAFITGYSVGTGKNENFVGSIEFSVMLMDKNGLERPHVIANIGGITDNFRKLITDYDETGKPKLKEEMYNKVFVINGHTVSAVNLRFNHAVLVSETPRFDKNYYQCDLPEEVLRANIL